MFIEIISLPEDYLADIIFKITTQLSTICLKRRYQ